MTAFLTTLHPRPAPAFDPLRPAPDREAALLTSLPQGLRAALDAGTMERRGRFTEDGFAGVTEHWLPPPVTPQQAAMARQALEELNATVLAPASPNHLLARMLALLSHYPAKVMAAEVEQMVALDWADDLGEYPAWAIDAAARVWRRTRKWRPSIAEMRALCDEACARERALAGRLRSIAAADTARPGSTRPDAVRAAMAGAIRHIRGDLGA